MTVVSRAILKQWFSRGKKPTEDEFAALIDSFYHKDEDSITAGGGGGEGTTEHNDLAGRAEPHSHPIDAITDLREAIDEIRDALNWEQN